MFRPKVFEAIRNNDRATFLADLAAGVTVGGPTGAFVPILASVARAVMGALKLGNLIKFIPYPVTSGFTSGLAVIIFAGQLKEFFGLNVARPRHTPHQVAAALFVRRMGEIAQIKLVTSDREVDLGGDSIREKRVSDGVLVSRIEGRLFLARRRNSKPLWPNTRRCRGA